MPQILEILRLIGDFFGTRGLAGGLIGAFLALAASYFTDVGLPIKDAPWSRKILFLFSGGLVGALFHHTRNVGMETCAMLGAGWTYVAIGFIKGAETLIKAKVQRRIGDAAVEELIKMAREKIREQEGGVSDTGP